MYTESSTWHVLQISAALDEELASALSESVNVLGWRPEASLFPRLLPFQPEPKVDRRSATLTYRTFPRLRGYARLPMSVLANVGPAISRLLLSHTRSPERDVLVCTTPFLAPVAERWRGPVVYWLTDRIAAYESAHGIDVPALDRRMCSTATLVCPNSVRLQDYLVHEADCAPQRIVLLPNAVRAKNLLERPLTKAQPLPKAVADRSGPVAGVIGNMGANLDWPLLLACVRGTPWLTWMFVGPLRNDLDDPIQHAAREQVLHCRNACFAGAKPYGELVYYARSFDVAVLPYRRREPTFSGSSTRFYEHLAACRPMLVTRGFHELLNKEPLIRLVSDAADTVSALEQLRTAGFRDGHEEARWRQSYRETWQVRAQTMKAALLRRLAVSAASEQSAEAVQDVAAA